jgi:hypothetical protein
MLQFLLQELESRKEVKLSTRERLESRRPISSIPRSLTTIRYCMTGVGSESFLTSLQNQVSVLKTLSSFENDTETFATLEVFRIHEPGDHPLGQPFRFHSFAQAQDIGTLNPTVFNRINDRGAIGYRSGLCPSANMPIIDLNSLTTESLERIDNRHDSLIRVAENSPLGSRIRIPFIEMYFNAPLATDISMLFEGTAKQKMESFLQKKRCEKPEGVISEFSIYKNPLSIPFEDDPTIIEDLCLPVISSVLAITAPGAIRGTNSFTASRKNVFDSYKLTTFLVQAKQEANSAFFDDDFI